METTTEAAKVGEKCSCVCHKMFGVFIALAGVAGLLGAFSVLSGRVVGIAASVLLVLAGLQTMMRGKCKCCNAV
jgi:hypothetical protein